MVISKANPIYCFSFFPSILVSGKVGESLLFKMSILMNTVQAENKEHNFTFLNLFIYLF